MTRWWLALALLLAMPAFAQSDIPYPLSPPSSTGGPMAEGGAGGGSGGVADPTDDVIALVKAAIERLDGIIILNQELQTQVRDGEVKRLDQLREAVAKFDEEMRLATVDNRNDLLRAAAELNAVRFSALERQSDLDREAVAESNLAARDTARELATGVTQSAKVLSDQFIAAAASTTENLTRLEERFVQRFEALDARLVTLEQFQNQGLGQARVTEPQIQELSALVNQLAQARATGAGEDSGQATTIAAVVGGIMLLITIMTAVFAAITFARKTGSVRIEP